MSTLSLLPLIMSLPKPFSIETGYYFAGRNQPKSFLKVSLSNLAEFWFCIERFGLGATSEEIFVCFCPLWNVQELVLRGWQPELLQWAELRNGGSFLPWSFLLLPGVWLRNKMLTCHEMHYWISVVSFKPDAGAAALNTLLLHPFALIAAQPAGLEHPGTTITAAAPKSIKFGWFTSLEAQATSSICPKSGRALGSCTHSESTSAVWSALSACKSSSWRGTCSWQT